MSVMITFSIELSMISSITAKFLFIFCHCATFQFVEVNCKDEKTFLVANGTSSPWESDLLNISSN